MSKLKKKYLFLLIIIIIGIVMGVIFSNILSNDDKKLVYEKITDYFNNLKNDTQIDYLKNLFIILKNNLLYLIIIWILGLSIIGLLLNNFILFFKSFVLGFSIGSIISIYLYNGLILSFLYIFPSLLINLLILMIMTYYANDLSFKLFEFLFRKKDYKFPVILKRYFKILGIFIVIMLFTSILETFLTPFLIKLFSFIIK